MKDETGKASLDRPWRPGQTDVRVRGFRVAKSRSHFEPEREVMPPLLIVPAALLGLVFMTASLTDEKEVKFSDCPAAVRKALKAETKGAKIETVTKEKDDDDQVIYWAEVQSRRPHVRNRCPREWNAHRDEPGG